MQGSHPGAARPRLLAALWAISWLALPAAAAAHEVPGDVVLQAFLKPEGRRLRLLIRAPLAALRDVDPPTHAQGHLDLARAEASLRHAAKLWLADDVWLYEEDARLATPSIVAARVSLPADPSFATYEAALAHLTGPPLPNETELYWSQAMLDVLLEYEIQSERSRFSIHPRLERLGARVVTALRLVPPEGAVRAYELRGDPGRVRLDPRWHQAAGLFVGQGFWHILRGTDHLLFLLCLIIPVRRLRPLVMVVTSFTLAHSLTLVASAFRLVPDVLWFPPLVETLIAISIVYMALENILAPQRRRRWIMAFAFGLVHGFGFSFTLGETLQFAGSHLLTSLLSFNLGVELGQLLVLLLLVPLLGLLFRAGAAARPGTIILSALVAHTGWHWMVERAGRLRQFRFEWPAADAALAAGALRWLMLLVIAAGLFRLVLGVWRRASAPPGADENRTGADEQA